MVVLPTDSLFLRGTLTSTVVDVGVFFEGTFVYGSKGNPKDNGPPPNDLLCGRDKTNHGRSPLYFGEPFLNQIGRASCDPGIP